MEDKKIYEVIRILQDKVQEWDFSTTLEITEKTPDPFKVLISCILSARTKDEVTRKATENLFSVAHTPEKMAELSEEKIQELIYPVGFYKNKAKNIKKVCNILVNKYKGKVPSKLDELLLLPGVGRKTANLVLTIGFDKPGICVDTHVHRITNRWGYVKTKTPEETEFALRKKLPRKYWIKINTLLVRFGQRICQPLSPFCSKCPVENFCEKIGVVKSR